MDAAPLYSDVAKGPEGGSAYWLTTSDGVRIRIGVWGPKDTASAGTILLFPGRTEYIEKYGEAAGVFAQAGYTTVSVAWRGQGLAERLLPERDKGPVGRFAD